MISQNCFLGDFYINRDKKKDLEYSRDCEGNMAFFINRGHIKENGRLDDRAIDLHPGWHSSQDFRTFFRIIDEEGNQTNAYGYLDMYNVIEIEYGKECNR